MNRKNRSAAVVSLAVTEMLESRALFSSVFELGGKVALSAGGHGVTTDEGDVAAYFLKKENGIRGAVATRDALPAGIQPYSDPNNPQIVGIDEDGLIIVQPVEYPDGEGLPTYPDVPFIPIAQPAALLAVDPAVPTVSSEVEKAIAAWQEAHPDVIDKDGIRVVTPLPESLAGLVKPLQSPPVKDANGIISAVEDVEGAKVTNPLDGNVAAAIGSGLNIILNKSSALAGNAAASNAFDTAAAYVESLFDDAVTVYIDADFSNLGANVVGSTSNVLRTGITYGTLRNALTASNSSSEALVDTLPTTVPQFGFDGNTSFTLGNFQLTNANSLALGLGRTEQSSAYGGVRRDATIRFSSSFSFDLDPTNGTTSGTVDFFSTAVHEMLHVLGFTSSAQTTDGLKYNGTTSGTIAPYPLDLFRLKPESQRTGFGTTTALRLLTTGTTASSGYPYPVFFDDIFVPTGISNFGVSLSTGDIPAASGYYFGDGRQASHWKDNYYTGRKIGVMDPATDGNVVESTRSVDQRMLGLIGWEVSGSGAILGDTGTLAVNGTSGANAINNAVSTNTSGGVNYTSSISAGSTTVTAFFNNADITTGFRIDGKAGNDTINGSTRGEAIYGGDGDDSVDANAGADIVYGGNGDDSMTGSSHDDKIYGEGGDDVLGGGNGNDRMEGGDGADLLEGYANNDTLIGGAGADGMFGNDDNDTFDAQDSLADLNIAGGAGDDLAYIDDEDVPYVSSAAVVF